MSLRYSDINQTEKSFTEDMSRRCSLFLRHRKGDIENIHAASNQRYSTPPIRILICRKTGARSAMDKIIIKSYKNKRIYIKKKNPTT